MQYYDFMGFPRGASGKEPACQRRRHKKLKFDPWVGKIAWRRSWQPTPVFLPGDPMDRGAWWAIVHGVVKSQARLSNCTSTTYYIRYNLTVVKKNYLHTNINNTYTY